MRIIAPTASLLIFLTGVIVTGAARAAEADSAAPAEVTETEIIDYQPSRPWPDQLDFEAGDCWTQSLVVPRRDAWRCACGNSIYDPCFALEGGEYVIAGADPSTGDPGFLIKLTKPLPEPEDYGKADDYVWMIELADGTVTAFMTGATGSVGEKRINFGLPENDEGDPVAIIGELHPGRVWTAEKATLGWGEEGFFIIESEMVPIRTIWR